MMAPLHLVALAALLPAAANPSLLLRSETMMVSLCSGGVANVPLGAPILPGSKGGACCAKGCHSGERRKRDQAA